jgi:hypothetical protein
MERVLSELEDKDKHKKALQQDEILER